MDWLNKLFKKEIKGKKLSDLLLSLGKDKKFIDNLRKRVRRGYKTIPFAYLDVKKRDNEMSFNMEIYTLFSHHEYGKSRDDIISDSPPITIKKTIPYEELSKNLVLKEYVKGKSLEKSLAVLSVASILASAFFISNNITGNAILTNNANSSGLIGAGLFVFGLGSWILARNI